MVELGKDSVVYKITNTFSFILTPTSTIFMTSLQTVNLIPIEHYWNRRLKLIRLMIQLNEIQSLQELASWTRPHILWTGTGVVYDTSNCQIIDRRVHGHCNPIQTNR